MSKSGNAVPVPWADLRAWIDAQEAAGQQDCNPKPMTRAQFAALSHFVDFLKEPEPDVSGSDYVSKLMHAVQAKKLMVPVYEDLEPIEVPVDGTYLLRWRTICTLSVGGIRSFPCAGYGLTEKGQPGPLFKSKKVAKQYAAKQALAYLDNQSPERASSLSSPASSSTGGAPLGSVLSPEARSLAAPSGNSNHNNSSNNSNNSNNVRPPPILRSPSRALASPGGEMARATSGDDDLDEREPPNAPNSEMMLAESTQFDGKDATPTVFAQVSELARKLNFDSPRYDVTEDPENPELFCGRPVFKNGGRIPEDLGVVKGAIRRKQAKVLIAEAVLAFFEKELKNRQGILEGFSSNDSSSKA